ncbi:hypothetical protein GF415_01255 [Candidatus Micrarchaeota archaeon]|nr:hypothetical protein [Candidatus Micrarchaeota archaeon]
MGDNGTAIDPPVDIDRLRQFISGGDPWLQERSVFAAKKNAERYGINSVPVGMELLSLALYHWNERVKDVAEGMVARCIKNKVESDKLMEIMVKTAEGAAGRENDGFFAECALIGLKNGHEKEAIHILGSVAGRDHHESAILDMVLENLSETFGEGSKFMRIKKKLERAPPRVLKAKAKSPAVSRKMKKPRVLLQRPGRQVLRT